MAGEGIFLHRKAKMRNTYQEGKSGCNEKRQIIWNLVSRS